MRSRVAIAVAAACAVPLLLAGTFGVASARSTDCAPVTAAVEAHVAAAEELGLASSAIADRGEGTSRAREYAASAEASGRRLLDAYRLVGANKECYSDREVADAATGQAHLEQRYPG